LAKGFSIVVDYRDALTQAIDSNDDMTRSQLLEELTDDALEIVARGMNNDYKSLLIK
jgi:hypothetical protein